MGGAAKRIELVANDRGCASNPENVFKFRGFQSGFDDPHPSFHVLHQDLSNGQADSSHVSIFVHRGNYNMSRRFWPARKKHLPNQPPDLLIRKAAGVPGSDSGWGVPPRNWSFNNFMLQWRK